MKVIKVLLAKNILLIVGLVYTTLITIAFLKSSNDLPTYGIIINDKIIHILIYIILSFIWLSYTFSLSEKNNPIRYIIWVLTLCTFYGIVIEILQEELTTTRQADIYDIFANLLGILIGTFFFWNVKNRIKT